MLKKLLVAFLTFYVGTLAASQQLPPIPHKCFEGPEPYCFTNELVDRKVGGRNQTFIVTKFFAKLQLASHQSWQEDIIGVYFDFQSWPEYVRGDDDVIFLKSEVLPDFIDEQGVAHKRHLAHYKTKAPFPINRQEVLELAVYDILTPYEGALYSAHFINEAGFELKGLKSREGWLHLAYDEATQSYYVYFVSDILPSIGFLESVAAKYIANSIVAIFKGMFAL